MSVAPAPTQQHAPTGSRWRRLAAPAAVGGAVLAASAALHFRDPHVAGSWGMCPTAALGFWCPGCGGLRAVNDLTHAEVVDAASSNLLFVASIPLILYAFARWTVGRFTGRAWDPATARVNVVAGAVIALMVVFTVLRNLPAGSWLAP